LAPFRDAERAALFRPLVFLPPRLADFLLADFRVLFRAELRPPRLADFAPRLADLRALFLAPFRADFLLLRLAEPPPDFFRDRLREPVRAVLPERPEVPDRLVEAGSSKSKDGDEVGVEEGVLSEGSGSIHPEPDQPISIK
jgi:hypothetical protein